jgi:hypothetical protein
LYSTCCRCGVQMRVTKAPPHIFFAISHGMLVMAVPCSPNMRGLERASRSQKNEQAGALPEGDLFSSHSPHIFDMHLKCRDTTRLCLCPRCRSLLSHTRRLSFQLSVRSPPCPMITSLTTSSPAGFTFRFACKNNVYINFKPAFCQSDLQARNKSTRARCSGKRLALL